MEKLKRQLGFWDSVAINVGIVIGVGIFRTPGEIARYVDTAPWILAAWVLGGVISLMGAFCYAELSSRFPETGGTYVFLREAYGKLVSFLFGWIEFSILRAGSIAAVAYVFTDYLYHFLPYPSHLEKAVVILVILVFTSINVLGIKLGTGVQNVLSSVKILSILLIIVLMFAWVKLPLLGTVLQGTVLSGTLLGEGMSPAGPSPSLAALAPAMIPILWTYGGWHQSTFMSGEFTDTRRALPLSLIVSILIVTAVYLSINSAYLNVLTPEQMRESKAIASEIFGGFLALPQFSHRWLNWESFVTAAVLISAGGALNSTVLTGGRIPFAVAQDYPKLGWIAHVDPKFGTPLRSILLNSLWASVLVLWGNFNQLLFFCAFASWLFFALAGASLFIFRRRFVGPGPTALGPGPIFQVPGFPWVPLLFILFSGWLCWTSIVHAPRETLLGVLLLLSGVPVYLVCNFKREMVSTK